MKRIVIAAILSSAVTLVAALPVRTLLENARVTVTEVTSPPGGVRERGVRAHDQVIVFLDDCRYERLDPATGEKTIRERKSGDVIWHSKGEDAPQLTNAGEKPYRTVVIELR